MTRAPGFWACRGVRAATSILPVGEVRMRYREELLAELHALDHRRRAAFIVGVLAHALSLRAAVIGTQTRGTEVTMRRKSLRCLLGVHQWRYVRNEDNQPFRRCTRCGKDHDGTWITQTNASGFV